MREAIRRVEPVKTGSSSQHTTFEDQFIGDSLSSLQFKIDKHMQIKNICNNYFNTFF